MRKQAIVLCVAVLLNVAGAHGQLNRSAVSVTGSDSNACTTTAPCRSIAYALTQTNAGGELIALTSGGYGPFVVNNAVTVEAAPGIYAGVTATTGTAISINAASPADSIVLRGLIVNSLGGGTGIGSGGGARVYVEHCTIHGFTSAGILSFYDISVTDTTIRNCWEGIKIDNAGQPVHATIDRVFVAGGGLASIPNVGQSYGIHADRNSTVSASHAVVTDVYNGFAALEGGILNLESCVSTHTYVGVWAGPPHDVYDPNGIGGFVRASNVMSTDNWFGFYRDPRGTLETWQTNPVHGNAFQDVYGFGPLTPVPMN